MHPDTLFGIVLFGPFLFAAGILMACVRPGP